MFSPLLSEFILHLLILKPRDALRRSSLSTVLRQKKYGKLQNMSQGLALSYGKGLNEHVDFITTLNGAFLSYPVPNTNASSNEGLLLEADASVRTKMFTDRHWFVPYLQGGLGISKYQGYWGTFIPRWHRDTDQLFWRSLSSYQLTISHCRF